MRSGRFPALSTGATLAMAHRSQLEGRLMAILDPKVPRSGVSAAADRRRGGRRGLRAAAARVDAAVDDRAGGSGSARGHCCTEPNCRQRAAAADTHAGTATHTDAIAVAEPDAGSCAAIRAGSPTRSPAPSPTRCRASATQSAIQSAAQSAAQGVIQGRAAEHHVGETVQTVVQGAVTAVIDRRSRFGGKARRASRSIRAWSRR